MDHTQLNFINRSNESDHHSIVIYQQNEALMNRHDTPIAWKVIENLGLNESHPFSFHSALEIIVGDTFGGYKPAHEILPGELLEIAEDFSGAELSSKGKRTYNPSEFGVLNAMRDGNYDVHCFRNDRVLATVESLYPSERALFRFSDVITVSMVPGAEEGEELDIDLLGEIEAHFDLTGIGSADIVMTGGGKGKNASPIEFSIENVKRKIFKPNNDMIPIDWWGKP